MFRRILCCATAALFTSCATTIVQKPAVDSVKTIAVVSVYGKPGIYNRDGESATGTFSKYTALLSSENAEGKESSSGDKLLQFGGTTLLEHSLAIYEKELSKVKGWKVKRYEEFKNQKAYQSFVQAQVKRNKEALGIMADMTTQQYLTVPGMAPFQSLGKQDEEAKMMKKLASDLGVDAIGVLHMDIAYAPSTAIAGTGSAYASVQASLVVYNAQGETAVRSAGMVNHRAKDTVPMVAGSIIFNGDSEAMFKSTINTSAEYYKDRINKEL